MTRGFDCGDPATPDSPYVEIAVEIAGEIAVEVAGEVFSMLADATRVRHREI